MAVISKLNYKGQDITKYNNATISNINFNGGDYHFAKPNESIRSCENAVEEPIIDLKVSGNSVQGKLPSEYQEVEYIESTGTQYINVGYIPKIDDVYKLKFSFTRITGNQVVFGSRTSGTYLDSLNQVYLNKSMAVTLENHALFFSGTTQQDLFLTEVNKIYELELSANSGNFNNTSSQPLYLFCFNTLGSSSVYSFIKLYKFEITNNNTVIRNLTPCYRKTDNVAGMYDLVEQKFYENNGTGTFIKGDNSPTPETPIEVESVGEYDETTGKYKVSIKVNDTTTNIYLNEPLRKIGDYADYIDYKNKKVVRTIKEKLLSRSDKLSIIGRGVVFTESVDIIKPSTTMDLPLILCSHYNKTEWALTMPNNGTKDGVSINSSANFIGFYDDVYANSLETFKTFLDNNNLKLYYVLTTPVEETIDIEEISTGKGTNVFDTDTSIKASEIKINYWKQI